MVKLFIIRIFLLHFSEHSDPLPFLTLQILYDVAANIGGAMSYASASPARPRFSPVLMDSGAEM